ncbi:MAG: hypothetical protein J6P21_03480 [Clostridia bacterium]|nr:hypothetical protein [Clostridia bacterium]
MQRMIARKIAQKRVFFKLPDTTLDRIDKELGIDEKLVKKIDDWENNVKEVTEKFGYIKQMRELLEQHADEGNLLTNEEFKQALENFKKELSGDESEININK